MPAQAAVMDGVLHTKELKEQTVLEVGYPKSSVRRVGSCWGISPQLSDGYNLTLVF